MYGILTLICLLYISSKLVNIPYSDKVQEPEKVSIHAITGQNNEWIPGMGRLEYLPKKAYNHTFYIATRKPKIEILKGTCHVQEEVKVGSHLTAKIQAGDENAEVEFPFIYYLGYTVRLDGMILETFETENGFLGCSIEANEQGVLEVDYTGTNWMNFSKIIAIFAWIGYIVYVLKNRKDG